MNEELNNNVNTKKVLLVPIMSIAIFTVLVFAAGYAYYTMNTTKAANTANGNIPMPNRATLVCNKTDSAASIPLSAMYQNKAVNVAGTASPTLTCSCTGGTCTFDVSIAGPSGFSVITANEVTVGLTSNNTTACASNAVHNWAAGKMTSCTLGAGKSVLLTGNVTMWNVNTSQDSRAGTTYVFSLSSSNPNYS